MLELNKAEQDMLRGDCGPALKFAMDVVVCAANILNAPRLIEATFVHVDSCHYYGTAHVDFAQFLVEHGAQFSIPAWTNTLPISLIDRDTRDTNTKFHKEAEVLSGLYVDMGCQPVWTCAPYQLPDGPRFGEQIIGSESNAVTYYNSVVGARTNKYGDFLDVCAGLVARVPDGGLHTDSGRAGTLVFDVSQLSESLTTSDIFYHVLGHLVGSQSRSEIPVIVGLPTSITVDNLKAMSAAVAASGGVPMFHAVGITPEAATLEQALQDQAPQQTFELNLEDLIHARDSLSTTQSVALDMVALGTPHFSMGEFESLVRLMSDRVVHPDVKFYVSTSRFVAENARAMGWIDVLEKAGVKIVVDTCTYFTPAIQDCGRQVMTNSAKWAYYAPGMLDVEVIFGGLEDCIQSACAGSVVRSQVPWGGKS